MSDTSFSLPPNLDCRLELWLCLFFVFFLSKSPWLSLNVLDQNIFTGWIPVWLSCFLWSPQLHLVLHTLFSKVRDNQKWQHLQSSKLPTNMLSLWDARVLSAFLTLIWLLSCRRRRIRLDYPSCSRITPAVFPCVTCWCSEMLHLA